ncbi:unnamed protein product [Cylicostephanus goldi]|uniref:Uncharacterized protein n=1 Tax=Cylicostephanus goldi TaxID=71465 RepID=A0A3P6T265_CYLGO|nr:unnamed protein product [Cylicostephanus goldi]
MAGSSDRGRDLIGVQKLIRKHQALTAEIDDHEYRIDDVARIAESMIEQVVFLTPEIRDKLAQLRDGWQNLKTKVEKRRLELGDFLHAHEYLAVANEAESWMTEKELIIGFAVYGKDEDSAEALLKKHETLMFDLNAFKGTIDKLRKQASQCKYQEDFVEKLGEICYSVCPGHQLPTSISVAHTQRALR